MNLFSDEGKKSNLTVEKSDPFSTEIINTHIFHLFLFYPSPASEGTPTKILPNLPWNIMMEIKHISSSGSPNLCHHKCQKCF